MHVEGTKDQVEDKNATVFLDSFRLGPAKTVVAGEKTPADKNPGDKNPGRDKKTAGEPGIGGRTKIYGGAFDPEFTDTAPDGGLVVGLEISTTNNIVRAARAIYRAGDKETLGRQYRVDVTRVVKLVAKPGYAVGAVTVKSGLFLDGMSVTFMKIDGDRLNTKDSYESEWIGGKGGGPPTVVGGTGAPVVGLIGKANKRNEVTGLGLLLQTTSTKIEKK